MTATPKEIETLIADLSLGEGHESQQQVVRAALHRMLIDGHRGVVLADAVGCGKTYEALAIAAHLCAYERRGRGKAAGSFERVLVLCKGALVRKWEDETSSVHAKRGFPQYVRAEHPARQLFEAINVHSIGKRASAHWLRREGLRVSKKHARSLPPGLYIVNQHLLLEGRRESTTLLKQIYRSHWDLVIVDEAHHIARGTKPRDLFAPRGDLRDYDDVGLRFGRILALTATPFELNPSELVNLLALVGADRNDLGDAERVLKKFQSALDRFFERRERPPGDRLRKEAVAELAQLRRHGDVGASGRQLGLEALLKRYLIRNTKQQNERKYYLVEHAGAGAFRSEREIQKLGNLKHVVRESPLIPFEQEHALFYLELRDVIQEVTERGQRGDESGTFVSVDLRQGLSSYQQLERSALLKRRGSNVERLRALVGTLIKGGRPHPKVAALDVIVRDIAKRELAKGSESWLSKVVVFNKLISGTAEELSKVLSATLNAVFGEYLDGLLSQHGMTRAALARRVRQITRAQLEVAATDLRGHGRARFVPDEFESKRFDSYRGRKELISLFFKPLCDRATQPLALIDFLRAAGSRDDAAQEGWISREVTGRAIEAVKRVAEELGRAEPDFQRAEQEILVELEESSSVGVAGRYDGRTYEHRESHRRNFNRRHNPFVLLVGQVGEEGIDLQEQCRYVLHYDVEWNPARMEQREGRVDRLGWGRADEKFIDVRFLLLKGTYEERIFHTVMQRDQWFQVLIGSKRRELGALPGEADDGIPDPEDTLAQDAVEDRESFGALTEDEKKAVMLDLRPELDDALEPSSP